MPVTPMLDGVELQQVQAVEVTEDETLEAHRVPALEGDFLQDLGRRATRIALNGVLTGLTAQKGLKTLRTKFHSATPMPFVEDISTAVKVQKVLIESMDIQELAGKPERFAYDLALVEYVAASNPKQQPAPQPPVPPLPSLQTGTLVVEVIVEGQVSTDFSSAVVSMSGKKDDGKPLSRTLSNRAANVWTEQTVPPGQFTAKAALTAPQAMSGTADAQVHAGETTKVTIVLRLVAAVAKVFIVHFRFDKAFVEPAMRKVLAQVTQYAASHPQEKLLIVGNTDLVGSLADPTGPDPYNQSLSERRARSVAAFLTAGSNMQTAVAEWNELRKRQTGPARTINDNWGTRQYQHMLQDLGFCKGNADGKEGLLTQQAVRAFRQSHGLPNSTLVDDAVWSALISDYLVQDNFAISSQQLLPNCGSEGLRWVGCASQDPVDRTRQPHRPNRRVELIFVAGDKLPCSLSQPDTFNLPAPGTAGSGWCLNADKKADDSKRACFVVPHLPANGKPAHGEWVRQPAEAGSITVQVSVVKETDKPDGTIGTQALGGQKVVVTAPDGEFLGGEFSSGEPQPAATQADGTLTFSDKPVGVYSLEVLASVLARLASEDVSAAKGNAVAKHLSTSDTKIQVVVRDM